METLILNSMRGEDTDPILQAVAFFFSDLIFLVIGLLWFQLGLAGDDVVYISTFLAFFLTLPPDILMEVDAPLAASLFTLTWVAMPWPAWICIWFLATVVVTQMQDEFPITKLPIGITWYLVLAMGLTTYIQAPAHVLLCYYLFGGYRLGKRLRLDLDLQALE